MDDEPWEDEVDEGLPLGTEDVAAGGAAGGVDDDLTPEEQRALYAPLQRTVERLLSVRLEKVTQELQEKQNSATKARARREELGVQLYGVQQELAKLQLGLEDLHEQLNSVRKQREDSQAQAGRAEEALHAKQQASQELGVKEEKYQAELDKLNLTLLQLQRYNEQMKSEIAVTRRATYKAEEAVGQLERDKRSQDYMVDDLNEQLKRLHEQSALVEAQLTAQQTDTRDALQTLQEARVEMEAVAAEKKLLLQQWRSSLVGMQRRDEALRATEEALEKQREQLMLLDAELAGFKQQLRGERETNKTLVSVLSKLRSETEFLTSMLNMTREKRDNLQEQYQMLRQALEKTDVTTQRTNAEMRTLQDELASHQKELQLTSQQVKALEERIHAQLSDQKTLQRCSQSTRDGAEKIAAQIDSKQHEATMAENELARIRIDAVNTAAENEQLKLQLQQEVDELKRNEKLIDQLEVDSKRRLDEVAKKQVYVDSLNRKFEGLMANRTDENTGPLEATINNLQKQIGAEERECEAIQHRWVRQQSDLVTLASQFEEAAERLADARAQQTVLTQKKLRLAGIIEADRAESVTVEASIRQCHQEIGRVNELLARNEALKAELAEAVRHMQSTSSLRMRELQEECAKLEAQLQAVASDKQATLDGILETEKEIMALERKIQLAREMQEALDPEFGQAETTAMKKEIQRMQLRYSQLQKQQRDLMVFMEKSVHRRENLAELGKVKAVRSQGETMATLRRTIESTKADIARISREAQAAEEEHRSNLMRQQEVSASTEELRQQCGKAQGDEEELRRAIVCELISKQRVTEEIMRLQRLQTKYKASEEGRYVRAVKDDAQAAAQLQSQRATLDAVRGVVAALQDRFPEHREAFARMVEPL